MDRWALRSARPGRLRRATAIFAPLIVLGVVGVLGAVRGAVPPARGLLRPAQPAWGSYVVVGLGDSVPAAGGCLCTSYVQLVGQEVARRKQRPATVHNLAVGGLTTSGLVEQLQQPQVGSDLAQADLIIITIGANDFDPALLTGPECRQAATLQCYRQPLTAQQGLLSNVLTQVNALTINPHAAVLVTGYWNVFLDGQVGRRQGATYVRGSEALTLADNAQIAAVSAADGATYVDLYSPFKGDGTQDDSALLAPDGDHPNQAGHDLIARAVEKAVS